MRAHSAPALRRPLAPNALAVTAAKLSQRVIGGRPLPTSGHPVNHHVAARLKLLRLINGKTQTELGAMLGMTFQQIAKYERGISKIGPDKLWKLAEYFGVDVAYFFEGYDPSADPNAAPAAPLQPVSEKRLRLELAAALQEIRAPQMLRSLLTLVRSVTA
jgi:transcriptional regulator with XRE-family HTH domain